MPGDVIDRFLRPLRVGRVTGGYPAVPPDLPAAARGLPELDIARCDSSGACAEVCPTRAITVADGSWTLDIGRCIFCADCARACPREALKLGHVIELGAVDRANLIVTHRLRAEP